MGSRKHLAAEKRKEARKSQYVARLNNVPTSPRKMRLVADLVRGMDVDKALYVLQYTQKESAKRLYKLLLSAIFCRFMQKYKNEDQMELTGG